MFFSGREGGDKWWWRGRGECCGYYFLILFAGFKHSLMLLIILQILIASLSALCNFILCFRFATLAEYH